MVLVSLFIPAYNEEKIIKENVTEVMGYIKNLPWDFEVFIVDDSSSDGTPAFAKELEKKNPNITYLRYENGPSRRENLAESFKKANGEVVMFMDMDLSTDLSYINDLIMAIEEGFDISTGSRYKGIAPKRKLHRKIISIIYNSFMKYYFGSVVCDHQCGFKAFRKDKLVELIDEMDYDSKFIRGWYWDAELLIRAQRKRLPIKEFPVKWIGGALTSFSFKRELKMIFYLLRLKSRLK
jgi:hypothetical protein